MAVKNRFLWISFFWFVSACMLIEALLIISKAESFTTITTALIYIASILAMYSLLMLTSTFFSRKLFSVIFSAGITFNLFSLKLIFYPEFYELNLILYWLIFAGIFIALSIVINSLTKHNKLPSLFVVFSILIIFSSPVFLEVVVGNNQKMYASNDMIFAAWKSVKLKEKPNIYLLSYDALIPSDVANDFLGIAQLPYKNVIKNRFVELDDGFSVKVPTLASLNSVMRLDQRPQQLRYDYFTGATPSIFEQMMHSNGYRVITGVGNVGDHYFGEQGSFVDEYLSMSGGKFGSPISLTTLCVDAGNSYRSKMRFLYICSYFRQIEKEKKEWGAPKGSSQSPMKVNWHKKIIEHIHELKKTNIPTVSLLYTFVPLGHAPRGYNHSDSKMKNEYKNQFLKNAEELSDQLEDIYTMIMNIDPDAVVIVFGDHGAYMSRNLQPEDNPDFFYRDRHRVLMAVMKTNNQCAASFKQVYTNDYHTPSRLIIDIISCLSYPETFPKNIVNFDESATIINYVLRKK